ncbi:MAG: electron transport complex subunit RsxC [candidate division WOR-3 bacterium]
MFGKRFTFPGGIKPKSYKELTKNCPIETLPEPKSVLVFFHQVIPTGSSAVPIVKPGDKVKKGEKIGAGEGKISSPVHSPISGIVREIKEFPHPVLGRKSLGCLIENLGDGETALLPENLSPWEKIKEAGIVGMGGAAFPTYLKLNPPKPVDTLIINGCECEPYLTGDFRVMVEYPEEVLLGAKVMAEILKAKKVIIAIEEDRKEAIESIGSKIKSQNSEIKFQLVISHAKYPLGGEKQLIKATLKREVPSGKIPYEVGVCVQNVQTTFAVYEAVYCNKPLYERVVTVSGDGINKPKNLRVKIGTEIKEIIDFCGGMKDSVEKIIFGGPLMGIAVPSPSTPTLKATTGILLFTRKKEEPARDCIRCGRCVSVCPMHLLPSILYQMIKNEEFAKAKEEGLLDCIECGCCAYTCPAKIGLVESFKMAKAYGK